MENFCEMELSRENILTRLRVLRRANRIYGFKRLMTNASKLNTYGAYYVTVILFTFIINYALAHMSGQTAILNYIFLVILYIGYCLVNHCLLNKHLPLIKAIMAETVLAMVIIAILLDITIHNKLESICNKYWEFIVMTID